MAFSYLAAPASYAPLQEDKALGTGQAIGACISGLEAI